MPASRRRRSTRRAAAPATPRRTSFTTSAATSCIQHYTTGPEQAALLADYLEAVRSEPRPQKPRRGPRAEIDLADVGSTGSIGVAPPRRAPSETPLSETAPPDAATPEEAVAEMALPAAAPPPAPLDLAE